MRPWPRPLRLCRSRHAPLRPAPHSCVLSAVTRFLAHTAIPVPETQRRSLTVSPGSETLLFDEEMLGVVVSQVQQSSLISSNLAMSRSLARGRGRSSSSPVVDPSPAGSSRAGRPHFKRSSSSSRSGGRKRFRGGKRSAPSSGPSGFRK